MQATCTEMYESQTGMHIPDLRMPVIGIIEYRSRILFFDNKTKKYETRHSPGGARAPWHRVTSLGISTGCHNFWYYRQR